MKFFKRNSAEAAAIPEDLQPYYSSQSTGLRNWIGPIIRIIALIAVLALIIWAGFWLVHKLTNRSSSNQAASNQKTGQTAEQSQNTSTPKKSAGSAATSPATDNQPKTTPTPAVTPTPAPAPVTNPVPAPSPATATTPDTPVASTSQPLTNTGPGEIIALFGVVTISGALLHRLYFVRLIRSW